MRSLKTDQKEIIAGIILVFLLGCLLVFVHARSVVNRYPTQFTLLANFTKADGIMNGADVRIAGLKVGYVSAQKLNDQYGVQMTLSFYKPVELSTDSSVSIETDGLMGSKHLEIVPGGEDDLLPNKGTISYTQDVLLLDELLDKVNDYMRDKKEKEGKDVTHEEKSS